jgi:hypothetical protein
MPLHKQKTTWAGLAAIISGLGAYFTGELVLFEAMQIVFTGLIGIFLRQGIAKGH